ncbi:MAG: hypothetical protein L3J74_06075, partial [Bacteroidales bacterium]|nr:hypothetical protein [Bacteroidales bacterium]
ILSFIMLSATIGITVSKHYCESEVQKHYFIDETNDTEQMTMNSMQENCEKDANCCHTETENIQLHIDYLQENKLEINTNFSFELLCTACTFQTQSNNSIIHQIFAGNSALPDLQKPSLSNLQTFRC